MTRKTIIAGICALFASIGLSSAQAGLIGTYSSSGGGGGGQAISEISLGFKVESSPFSSVPYLLLLPLVDGVHMVDSGPLFDDTVELLTNGVNDWLTTGTFTDGSLSGEGSLRESSAFSLSPGPDFQGLVISKIVATLSNTSVTIGASSYSYSYNIRIDVYDDMPEVPLPAAAPLFLAGLAGVGFFRRRRAMKS